MLRKCFRYGLAVLMVGLVVDVARAAGIGPFEFSFANSTITYLALLPLRLAGCMG